MSNLGPSLEDLLSDTPKEKKGSGAEEKLTDKITEITLKEKEEETQSLAQAQGLSYINLFGFPIGPDALTTISKEDSKKTKTVCFLNTGKEIKLGTVDYNDKVKN